MWMTEDTQKRVHQKKFLELINSINPCIQLTVEETRQDDSIPFLDNLVMPEPGRTLSTAVYRMPTHTDQ